MLTTLAIMLRQPTWEAVEEGLTRDMGILAAYLHRWCLRLSIRKTVTAAFHLNNREAKRELEVFVDGQRVPAGPKSTSACGWTERCPTNNALRK